MFVGAFVALVFFGLPLAIIGLFIASILDRRNAISAEGFEASREPAVSVAAMDYGGDKRRRVIYGRYSVVTTVSAGGHAPNHAPGHKP
jgi:hypothetical protein